VFYFILGLLFGVVQAHVLSLFLNKTNSKGLKFLTIQLLTFLIIVFWFPSQGINQFRFWTGALFFILALQNYLQNRKVNVAVISFCILAVITHIGTGTLVLILILFIFFRKISLGWYLLIAGILFLTNNILNVVFSQFADLFGGAVESKFTDYTGDIAETRLVSFKERNWYAAYWREIGLVTFGAYLFLNKLINKKQYFSLLEKFSLFIVCISPLFLGFYMHFRYFEVFVLICLFAVLNGFYENRDFTLGYFLISPTVLLFLGLKISGILQLQKIDLLIGNMFTTVYNSDVTSISSLFGIN
jgi:hypothetical protein